MTLYMIGIGLHDEKDMTLKGLELVKGSDEVFLENYTAVLSCPVERLESLYGKKVRLADRSMVEKDSDEILDPAVDGDVALLVVGDPMAATTHIDLFLRARKKGVDVRVIHNASILNAVGSVGLEMYKYGKTTSIVFPEEGWNVDTPYDVIKQNQNSGLHTLCLLDIKVAEPSREDLKSGRDISPGNKAKTHPRYMTINQAIQALLDIESRRGEDVFTRETLCVGCARLGASDMQIKAGTAKELLDVDFGSPLHSLIVPGNLHFVEEEVLELWK